jgi:hypothetical protein
LLTKAAQWEPRASLISPLRRTSAVAQIIPQVLTENEHNHGIEITQSAQARRASRQTR